MRLRSAAQATGEGEDRIRDGGRSNRGNHGHRAGTRSTVVSRLLSRGALFSSWTLSSALVLATTLVSAAVLVTGGTVLSSLPRLFPHITSALAPDQPAATVPHSRLAVCVAVRDSPENVLEWVRYHHNASIVGVDKFYIMVTDDPDVHLLRRALQAFIDASVVELYDLPHVNPRTVPQLQVALYARCLDSVRDLHDYVGFWDVDEYIVPRDASVEPFREFLAGEEVMRSGGVALNWRIVGPSGHATRPLSGGLLDNYRMCTPWSYAENEEIKSVVRTEHAVRPLSDPHTFEYKEGYHAVDPEGRVVSGGRNPAGVGDPRYGLYHFVTKSKEEYREKMRRGSAMGNRKDMSYYELLERVAVVPCGLRHDATWGCLADHASSLADVSFIACA